MFPEGRLFDFLIVGAVALIVVGPKDLPVLMRKVGQFMARVRGMAAEFRASFDELARQSELDELRREVQALRTARPMDYAASHLGAGEIMSEIKADIDETNAAIAAHAAPTQPPVSEAPAVDAAPAPSEPSEAAPATGAAEPAKPTRKASAS